MGTRNLTLVRKDGDYKVAQYGQWDGYPEGVGADILQVLNIYKPERIGEVVEGLAEITSEELRARLDECGANGSTWVGLDVSEAFTARWPWLSRDCSGGHFLRLLLGETVKRSNVFRSAPDWTGPVDKIRLDKDFVYDSLFCEFCYLIDLDRNVFEVYGGFKKSPGTPPPGYEDKPNEDGYYPVSLAGSWPLSELPTVADINALFEDEDEEDDEVTA